MVELEDIKEKELEFQSLHGVLRAELNNGYWHFSIWKCMGELGKDYIDELNQAPAFFQLTVTSQIVMTVLTVNKLLDTDRRALKIDKFLDFVKRNLYIFSDIEFERRARGKGNYEVAMAIHNQSGEKITEGVVDKDRKCIQDLDVDNLVNLRNKMIAHIDGQEILERFEIVKKYPVSVKEIEPIFNVMDEILNRYSVAFDGTYYVKDLAVRSGIIALLDTVRKGRRA